MKIVEITVLFDNGQSVVFTNDQIEKLCAVRNALALSESIAHYFIKPKECFRVHRKRKQ